MTFASAPIGAVLDVRNGATPAADNTAYWNGEIPWVTPADLGALDQRIISGGSRYITREGYASCGTQLVPAGSLVLSIRAPIGHLAIATVPMAFNQGCRGLVPRRSILPDFAYWALLAVRPALEAAGQGSTFMELSRSRLRSLRIPLPSLDEQRVIANFLDRETARIDALIAKKERLIELVERKWLAELDSLILGHGCSPAYTWTPLKYLTDSRRPIMYGIVLPGPNVDDGVMIVKGGDVKPDRLRPDRLNKTTYEIEASYARSRLKAGDLVFAIRGSVGDCEIVPPSIEGANLTQDAARIAPASNVDEAWLRYALLAPSVLAPAKGSASGAAVKGINIFDLKRVMVPTPTAARQPAIAVRLAETEARLVHLRSRIQQHRAKILEFRSALVTAAVTGEIDPGTWARRGNTERALATVKAAHHAGVAS